MMKSKYITFLNFKGGVGKTTSVQNIGAALAMQGYKTLLIDIDPQHNLTHSFGIADPTSTVYEAMRDNKPLEPVKITESLYIAPNDINMIRLDMELVNVMRRREYRLRDCLAPIAKDFDFILIDCPPSLSLSTINALFVNDDNFIIVPVESEYLSLKGFTVLQNSLKEIGLQVNRIFVTKYDSRKAMSKQILQLLQSTFVSIVYNTHIRTNVSLAEAQSQKTDIFTYSPSSNGATDYNSLTNEILKDVN